MRHALVFGGTGQIGTPVLQQLLANGWQVSAVSRDSQPDGERLTWLRGELQHVESLPARVDAIFSLGPLDAFSQWYASASVASPRVIAFGSTSLGTKQDSIDPHERDVAARLQAAETLIFATAERVHAQATVLRPTLVYGAGRDRTLTQIAALARRTGFFLLPRTANGLRQPVHVQDLAAAAVAVIDASASHGRSYALPGGETLPYAQMVERVLASLQPRARLIQVPAPLFNVVLSAARTLGKMQGLGDAAVARMGDDLVFDVEPARRDFGYSPRGFNPTSDMFV